MNIKNGFTLIEVLVGVGILSLIGAITLVSFVTSRNVRDLTSSAQNTVSVLRLAQEKSLGGEDDETWGVRVDPVASSTKITLFRGTSAASASFSEQYSIPNNLEYANLNINGGGNDIIFKKITGTTDQYGKFDIRVKGASQTIPITITSSGKVYMGSTTPAIGNTRIFDTRHRSLVLGWSIQNATTLTLTFSDPPNPDTVQNITMDDYFDSGKTKFDWSDSITIGGQVQILRIHTTSLTGTNTTLSVDRDCRKNSKKVRISIDGSTIATYEADCSTITLGSFGGVMSEP